MHYVLTTYAANGDILAKFEFDSRDDAEYFSQNYDLDTPGLNIVSENVETYTIERLK